jgi:predicted dehydrogenase
VADPVRVGIVGAGAIAAWHVGAVREHGDADVVSVFDIDATRARAFKDAWGIREVSTSLDQLVNSDTVDAVLVCTPPNSHVGPAVSALEAGKHVLCEKPFAVDVADAQTMARVATTASGSLACASSRLRFSPAQQAARKMIDNYELGDVYHVRLTSWRLRLRPGHHFLPRSTWFLNRAIAGGGVIMDVGVYAIDSALWLLGDPEVLSVTAQTRRISEVAPPEGVTHDVEDHAVIMIQCEGGKSAVIETSWVSNMTPADGLIVLGTQAGLRFDPLTKITARRLQDGAEDPMVQWFTAMGGDRNGNGYFRAVEEPLFPYPDFARADPNAVTNRFLEDIRAGAQPQTSPEESLKITRVIDAAYRSAAEGIGVSLSTTSPIASPPGSDGP